VSKQTKVKSAINRRPLESESAAQKSLVEYLRVRGFTFLHVPNEGKRTKGQLFKLLAEGLSPGAPDMLIFNSPQVHRGFDYRPVGVAIELKTLTGKVTKAQVRWLRRLAECGWAVFVCRGSKQAIRLLSDIYPNPMRSKKGQTSGDNASPGSDTSGDNSSPEE